MTSSVACGVTFGLPSRSPPIHVPNVSGRASIGSSTPMRASSSSSASSVCGHRVVVQRVEVVDGVARLVDRLGAHDAKLVGLPQEVDELLEAAVHAALGVRVERQAVGSERALPVVEQARDPADLREDGPARRLGRVRGEDRAQVELAQVGGDLAGGVAGGLDAVDRLLQPRAVLQAHRGELAAAVNLLGDVDEVEVGRERADEAGRVHRVEQREHAGRGVLVAAHQGADLLDELEQLVALLADERLAEQRAERADVAAQALVGPRWDRRDGGGGLDGHSSRWTVSGENAGRQIAT